MTTLTGTEIFQVTGTIGGKPCSVTETVSMTDVATYVGGVGVGLTVGSTAITGGTTTRILYNNAGTLGEYTLTGTGTVVAMATSPSFTTPILGTPTSGTLTNCTIPVGGVSGLGTGVATFLATPSSANLASAVTDEAGSGPLVFANTPTLVTPVLGVATATSLAIGGATLGANGLAVTGHVLVEGVTSTGATGTGAFVFATTPTLVTPVLGVATGTSLGLSGSVTFSTASSGIILKQGANGTVGTFVANGTTPVTVSNTSVAVTDAIIVSLNTVGGTVGAVPAVKTITAATGFTIAGTASDTSTYNYTIIKNAA